MAAIHGRSVEYGKAFRKHEELTKQLGEARQVLLALEEETRKAEQTLSRARRELLEEAQTA